MSCRSRLIVSKSWMPTVNGTAPDNSSRSKLLRGIACIEPGSQPSSQPNRSAAAAQQFIQAESAPRLGPFQVSGVMETLSRLKAWLTRNHEPAWLSIDTDASGFSVGDRRLDWSQICSVAAFKRDMLTFDDVWFQLEGVDGPVMVCEEQPGFADWEAALCERFPSVASWRDRVIQPPFAENFTILYRRT